MGTLMAWVVAHVARRRDERAHDVAGRPGGDGGSADAVSGPSMAVSAEQPLAIRLPLMRHAAAWSTRSPGPGLSAWS